MEPIPRLKPTDGSEGIYAEAVRLPQHIGSWVTSALKGREKGRRNVQTYPFEIEKN